MKVKARYTFRVDLGFGNVYEFFEGKITEIKDSDAAYLFEKYPGMLDVVSGKEEKNEEVSDVNELENNDNETKSKGQKNKSKK